MTDPSTRNDSRENETLAPREAADEGKETVDDCVAGETESTPKSEVPPALNVTTPGTTEAIARQAQLEAGTEGGYFDSHPGGRSANVPTQELQVKRSQSQLHTPSSTNRSAIPTSTSNATAPGHIDLPDPQTSLLVATRPPPHTTQSSLSIESSTSTSTIRPESPNARPQRPSFPNQAFSALHSQDHGKYYLPPSARRGGPHPHQISTFASAIASLHSSGVRTANNSPAVTPSSGLFSPAGPPSAPAADGTESTGTYASPFLHFTHTHVPKETHVADVDVDPVSGRKLINHYEIIDELGRGTHGKVKLGRDLESSSTQPTYVAIKIVERFSKRRKLGRLGTTEDKVKKEVAILKKARHPNVVALLEVIDDPSRKKVYIVLEWVERGEINWRVKGPREIAMIEARRFEREKSGNHSERALAEDSAVLTEAQKRLQKQKRNQLRAYRQMKRGVQDAPEFWSVEMMGDNESEESEEDRLSRISSLTAQSDAGRLAVETPGRRPSRTPSPLQASADLDAHYLSLTSEPETTSPTSDPDYSSGRRPSSAFSMSGSMSGLEGTMYGPYDPMYSQTSRVASLNSLTSSRSSTADGLTKYANEVLEAPLDSELEYVPVMTMEQIRVAFRDTLLGLQYLHYQGIVHRDIKPPNLLATIDNRVKISDFGVSYLGRPVREGEAGEDVSEAEAQDLGDEAKELAKTVGTPAFYAPELCTTDPTDDPMPVTKAIDVWALGVTLYCMLFGRTPFVDNEFVVMRQIADEEVYLPRRRLQPVDLKPKSRPNSHSRGFLPLQNGRRHELDLVYEEINDDLHDLMKRLLTKDPRKRITLEEVRHHPWVVADLSNPLQWLEETDPSRQSEGKKIEVSKEELNLAVVPLNLVERMRSGMKKILDRTGITRTRAQSNAGSAEKGSPAGSANSSSSTISQDARRQSMRGDESIYNALHKYREGEHPLSKSLAATPENEKHEQRYFDRMPKPNGIDEMSNELSRTPSRPSPPQRAMTVHSAAGSMRTVTQSDYRKALAESPPPSPGLPGTPMALASPGGNHLSGIFGGPSRLIKSVRERSTQSTRRHRTPSSSRGSVEESDHHAEASIAVSHTSAAGHVHAPETLDRFTPNSSAHNSPASSRPHSVVSDHAQQQHLHPVDVGPLSRKSSTSSLASVGRRMGETFRSGARSRSRRAPESSAEDWKRADEERVRKLVRQGKEEMEREKISPQLSESPRAFDGGICPTSPDDLRPRRDDSRVPSLAESSNPDTPADTPSEGFSPTNQTGQLPPALVSSSSDLGSAVSMSISNPSIPSVISEASSVDPRDLYYTNGEEKREQSSDETLNPSPRSKPVMDELVDEGYTPDQELALDTDRDEEEFDSSSDSDGGLVMSRRKSAARGHGLVVGTETPKERRGTGLSTRSKKSSRSGSNNTMKKVRTRESGDERRSMEISEE